MTTPADLARFSGSRSEAWNYYLHDRDGRRLGRLHGVTKVDLSGAVSAVIRTGGKITWIPTPLQAEPDWSRVLIMPVHRVTFADGTSREWPLGLFIPATPTADVEGTEVTREIDLYDRLLHMDEDGYPETFAVPEGAIVTDVVRAIIAEAGIGAAIVTDSAETLSAPMVWEGGTSRLRVINDLLAAIGYFSLWADGHGYFRVEPYVPPSQRTTSWDLSDGDTAIITPEHSEERDTFGAPNRVVCVSRSETGEDEPLIAVAEVTDPEDPRHVDNRGRWVSRRYDDVEASSQEVLDGIAERYLADAGWTGTVVTVTHLPLPLEVLDLNDLVTFNHSVTGADLVGVVQKWKITSDNPTLTETTIREIKQ